VRLTELAWVSGIVPAGSERDDAKVFGRRTEMLLDEGCLVMAVDDDSLSRVDRARAST
jgi:hypothetical protein